jgi:TP53 regulating kinase-like protein
MSLSTGNKRRRDVPFEPPPRSDWTMISQGAEARVWKLRYRFDPEGGVGGDVAHGSAADGCVVGAAPPVPAPAFIVCKERFSKTYRHPDLDAQLTKSRCRSEAKVLEKCATRSQIRVPRVLRVDPPNLFLEYLDGDTVKDFLRWQAAEDDDTLGDGMTGDNVEGVADVAGPGKKRKREHQRIHLKDLASSMGELVGRLHNIGVVHGDLTTSNMVLLRHEETTGQPQSSSISRSFELALIDFGLAKSTTSVEDQAVDLYVLERALQSTHPHLPESFFDAFLEAYSFTTTDLTDSSRGKNTQSTLQRLEQVRQRGRKRECFG